MEENRPSNPFLSNAAYDKLKFVALILLPALGALYFGLAAYWHWPKVEEVVGTITVIDTFLGVLLGLTTKQYYSSDAPYDGVMNIEPGKNSLVLNDDVEKLEQKKALTFKVNPPEGGAV